MPVLPAASRAVTVITLVPAWSATLLTDQLVLPAAVPLPPTLLLQVTCVTPTLSAAVPPSTNELEVVLKVLAAVGVLIVTVGGVGS